MLLILFLYVLSDRKRRARIAEVVGSNPTGSFLTAKPSAHFVITVSLGLVYPLHDSNEQEIRKK
jgi:hypothetical protein